MVPFLLAAGAIASAVGLGVSIYGSSQANSAQQQILAGQQALERNRRKVMELDARRRTLEVVRQQQRARALALTAATNQGAGEGSGLQGGFGQIAGQTGVNLLGISQNLALGGQAFNINQRIGGFQQDYADAQGISYLGQGISSLGGSLMSSATAFGNLTAGGSSTNQGFIQPSSSSYIS